MAVAPVSVAHVEPSAKRQSGPAGLVGQTARRPRRALFYRILPVLFVARRNLARQRRWACNSRWRFFDAYGNVVATLLFFWVRLLDYVVAVPFAIDAACGLYFLGRKAAASISPQQAIDSFQGVPT